MSVAVLPLRQSRLAQFFNSAFSGSSTLSYNALALLFCAVICFGLQLQDTRELHGANVWVKPAKFYVSMTVHFFTLAWAMHLAPEIVKQRSVRLAVWALLTSAWGEMIYVTYRASMGEASHFNTGTPVAAALYALMGIGSVFLVLSPAVIAIAVWRAKPHSIWHQSVAIGFCLALVLTMIVGFTLSSYPSHWIGGDQTDATGLPIFKWSSTGGDLRVAHFLSLHAMQIVPLSAVTGKKSVVLASAAIILIVTALLYLQAINGIPLLRV